MDAATLGTVINHASNGSNTLLFKAAEYGHRDVVQFLLDQGADARIHPVTKYSPLYIAAYNGKKEVGRCLSLNDVTRSRGNCHSMRNNFILPKKNRLFLSSPI